MRQRLQASEIIAAYEQLNERLRGLVVDRAMAGAVMAFAVRYAHATIEGEDADSFAERARGVWHLVCSDPELLDGLEDVRA